MMTEFSGNFYRKLEKINNFFLFFLMYYCTRHSYLIVSVVRKTLYSHTGKWLKRRTFAFRKHSITLQTFSISSNFNNRPF